MNLMTSIIVKNALERGALVPGFNIPYLPMMEPVVRALHDCGSFGLVMVARLEWIKFESGSMKAIYDEYQTLKQSKHTRLHLDHIPVIDEDNLRVDFEAEIAEALDLGYESVMVDGSRLPLVENIEATAKIIRRAAKYGVPVEAELGAVMGHEAGEIPPYEELFTSRRGFTDVEEARRFVAETGVDWFSVAVGNIHGAISAVGKQREKPRARIDLEHLSALKAATGIPLVLHGGTGIPDELIRRAVPCGIAKINIATAIRQPYERNIERGVKAAQNAVYDTMISIINDELQIGGSAEILQEADQ